ncbi:MAG: hypothetical protein SFX18_13060 [Pirellulales bacterium]|nr:hypothetical protein [Pirellulales bacterium]
MQQNRNHTAKRLSLALAIALGTHFTQSALAVDRTWDGNGLVPPNGTFSVAANWDTAVPLAADRAIFNIANAYTVTLATSPTYTQNDVTAGTVNFRSNNATVRTVTLTGADALNVDNATLSIGSAALPVVVNTTKFEVGLAGAATIEIDGGNSALNVSGPGTTIIGLNGNDGTVFLSNGATLSFAPTAQLNLGISGFAATDAFLNIQSGSTVTAGDIFAGTSSNGGEGNILITGAGSLLNLPTAADSLTLGAAVGTEISDLDVINNGTLTTAGITTINNTGDVFIATNGTWNANNNVSINGGSLSLLSTGNFNLGANRTLAISNSGEFSSNKDLLINSGQILNVTAGGELLGASSMLVDVGDATTGATVTVDGTGSRIAESTGSASLRITGGAASSTVTVSNGGNLSLPSGLALQSLAGVGNATLNLQSGGTVTANTFSMLSDLDGLSQINIGNASGNSSLTLTGGFTSSIGDGAGAPDSAVVSVNGGGAFAAGTNPIFINSTGLLHINGGNFSTSASILINGGEFRRSSNTSLIFGNGTNFTILNAGELNATSPLSFASNQTISITDGGKVQGTGFVDVQSGTVVISDPGTTWSAGFNTFWGFNSADPLNVTISNQAVVTLNSHILRHSGDGATNVTVETGATLNLDGTTSINSNAGTMASNATITVTGSGSTIASSGASSITLGRTLAQGGTARIEVLNGGSFAKTTGVVILNETGVFRLDGGTAVLPQVDYNGGRIEHLSGSLTIGDDLPIGINGAFGDSNVTISSDEYVTATGVTTIRDFKTLTLAGGSLTTADITIPAGQGQFAFFNGTLNLTGPGGLTVGAGGLFGANLTVGANQNLNVTNITTVTPGSLLIVGTGGDFSSGSLGNSGEIILGSLSATISGGTVFNNGLIRGDGRFQSQVTNNTAGVIRAESGDRIKFEGTNGPNSGRINLQGGTAEFLQPLTNGGTGQITGRGTLVTGGTGLNNLGNVALSSGISDIFGDVLNNTGNAALGISVSGNADVTFWDDVTNTSGLFRVSAGSSATFFGGYSGGGISGTGDLYFEGDITPGFSPADVAFEGDVAFGPAANLVMELGGNTLGFEYDHLQIGGLAQLDGLLSVRLIDGYRLPTGASFDLFDLPNARGQFSGINLPGNPADWDLSQLYSTGQVTYVGVAIPEPSVWLAAGMAGAGLVCLGLRRRR